MAANRNDVRNNIDDNWDGESTTASQMGEEEKAELREKLARAEQERESQAEEIRRLTVQLFQANAEKQVAEECSKQNAARAAEEITTKKREIDTLRQREMDALSQREAEIRRQDQIVIEEKERSRIAAEQARVRAEQAQAAMEAQVAQFRMEMQQIETRVNTKFELIQAWGNSHGHYCYGGPNIGGRWNHIATATAPTIVFDINGPLQPCENPSVKVHSCVEGSLKLS
jgi:hypothetical protein